MTRLRHAWHQLFGIALLVILPGLAAGDSLLPLWQLNGNNNRVYLLGSIHLLRETDLPLPEGILRAYRDAEAIVMELDTDDLDMAAAQALTVELGILGENSSLAAVLGPVAFAEAESLAASAEIPLEMLAKTEPWLAAISVEQILLTRLGFNAAFGLEQQVTNLAIADGKSITGLETLRQQLEILDGLPAGVQQELLLQVLADGAELGDTMNKLVTDWRRGDIAELERSMLDDMREMPVLHAQLVVARNQDWVRQIRELLDDDDDYLVVVGALHMVGDDGLPALLRQSGYTVRQLAE